MIRHVLMTWVLVAMGFGAAVGQAADRTWTGTAGDKNWFTPGNWNPSDNYPQAGESATIASGTVILNASTLALNVFTITNATLTFTNWSTTLTASSVFIRNGATVTLPPAYTNTVMSNRVHFSCSSSFTLDKGGTIDGAGKGYAGGVGSSGYGSGPGGGAVTAGAYYGGGAGHGGSGGDGYAGNGGGEYDSTNAPMLPGSGGGGPGGAGGGAVWIEANGAAVTVNGTISVNAASGAGSGGGSGGSILVNCLTFSGTTNGLLSATGGTGYDGGVNGSSGGGAAGRIAVIYDGTAQAALAQPRVRISTAPGRRGSSKSPDSAGEAGSLYLPDTLWLSDAPANFLSVRLYGVTSWSPDRLMLTNAALWFAEDGFRLTVTNDILCATGGVLTLPSFCVLNCGGNLTLTNGGSLAVYGGITSAVTAAYGALVSVTGTVSIGSGSWVYPYSAWVTNGPGVRPLPTNNAAAVPLFVMSNLTVAAGGGFDASGLGFAGGIGISDNGFGPGRGLCVLNGYYGGGGSHGGKGATGGGGAGGSPYDRTNAPIQPGSGGGGQWSGVGGGGIRLDVAGTASVLGTLSASATSAEVTSYGGGGGGGSVFLMCGQLYMGTTTVITANGGRPGGTGSKNGGGGGGGRIAVAIGLAAADRQNLAAGQSPAGMTVFSRPAPSSAAISATGGVGYTTGYSGSNGTVVFLTTNNVLAVQGNPAEAGLPAPQSYGSQSYSGTDVWVTNSVGTPADRAAGAGWAGIGWKLAVSGGAQVDSGSGTQAVVHLTNNMTLTWNWTNEYQLTVESSGPSNGSVNASAVNGWYTNGTFVSGIFATASNGYLFSQWEGVSSGQFDNPLSVTMTNAKSLMAVFVSSTGVRKTWTGSGAWESSTNWSPSGMPGSLDEVIVQSGSVLFGSARSVGSLIISNGATMTFTNWTTRLTASNVTVQSGGKITLAPAFTDSQMSNRIYIVCTNFTLETNATIDATGLGYKGGVLPTDNGSGPGRGLAGTSYYGGGGSHGGAGGDGTAGGGGAEYDATNAPVLPGSGGGGDVAGAGGGAVRIDAASAVTLNGTIMADGLTTGSVGGGGAGGSILINCVTFSGATNGLLTAKGGNGKDSNGASGGGAGGRIAVLYGSAQPRPGVRFSVAAGLRSTNTYWNVESGEAGTLYLPDTTFLSETMANFLNVRLLGGGTNWSADHLALTNRVVWFGENGFVLTVTNHIVCDTGSRLTMPPRSVLNGGGNLTLTNGGALAAYGGITNALTAAYGSLVSVAGNVVLSAGSWVYSYSTYVTNGAGQPPLVTNQAVAVPLFTMNNLTIAAGAGFNADDVGFGGGQPFTGQNGFGPGGGLSVGYYGGGGGHGGAGGLGEQGSGGSTYDRTNAPIRPGSGGGSERGMPGGGGIRIEARGVATIDGALSANAPHATALSISPGGSGGSIFLTCQDLRASASARLTANGGNAGSQGSTPTSGAGGGGRIAVWIGTFTDSQRNTLSVDGVIPKAVIGSSSALFLGTVSATNGTNVVHSSRNGLPGTVAFITLPASRGTIILIR